MHPRSFLIQQLYRHLLGPRQGPEEHLPLDAEPRDEYVTGVLEGADTEDGVRPDIESEVVELEGEASPNEEDEVGPWGVGDASLPHLDPRREPSSMGLSFVVEVEAAPRLSLCCTFARYQRTEDGWKRQPRCWLGLNLEPRAGSPLAFELPDDPARLVIRTLERDRGRWQITVFLVNGLSPGGRPRYRSARLLFQPQIRVCLDSGTRLVGLTDLECEKEEDEYGEEQRLRLLYRNLPVKARGHFCGALWREVDPEPAGEPFGWVDREACPAEHRERFASPDLRTEFLPVAAVSSPSMEWRHEFGPEPVREANRLAECWDPNQVRAALGPLLDGYAHWLEKLEREAACLPGRYRAAAEEHVALCRESSRRMRCGLELLIDNPQARLAFCFANRAIHEQSSWRSAEGFKWRPFQLAFFLQGLAGLTDPESADRLLCDLLWFPTGGGKTEAYLGMTAYVLALRRLRKGGCDGTAVISRYTLRLLSIQQFRRALKLVTACEVLRVLDTGRGRGWRPAGWVEPRDWLWGKHRFSAGLWVGGGVTPNKLERAGFPPVEGALENLVEGRRTEGEPAQVLNCPVCGALLAVPGGGHDLPATEEPTVLELALMVSHPKPLVVPPAPELSTEFVEVLAARLHNLTPDTSVLEVQLRGNSGGDLGAQTVDDWWSRVSRDLAPVRLLPARASRPGYFVRYLESGRGPSKPWNFEVFCPAPGCPLGRVTWREKLPVAPGLAGEARLEAWQPVHPAFASPADPGLATRVPIPAQTVDDQIYAWPPSLLVSTVDKFARISFEPRAAALFGNVEHYHPREGYYREGCTRTSPGNTHPPHPKLSVPVRRFSPPDLILQDELHLIDGPLGSMVGLYETVIEDLCRQPHPPKYLASTATVREARDQVQALFCRELRQFPAPGLEASDSFFALIRPGDPFEKSGSGRVYVGLCAPGRGALTPFVRLWAVLLQAVEDMRRKGVEGFDPYWTPVGYFNAISQLASVTSLWRQYIPQRMALLSDPRRELSDPIELSSRIDTQRLPTLLHRLERPYPEASDGAFATSMFGTGVDVSRLSLMVVHGQPKTTSAYIQATGRVGRASPGLIVTAYLAHRPRELNHYEYFLGYHLQLYRGVEPVTVFPYSPRARERSLGPLCVAWLRQWPELAGAWRDVHQGAVRISSHHEGPEFERLFSLFEARVERQPEARRPETQAVRQELQAALDRWRQLSNSDPENLVFQEYTISKSPSKPVVLGDPQHLSASLEVAFRNVPQSLREVEPTTGFKV